MESGIEGVESRYWCKGFRAVQKSDPGLSPYQGIQKPTCATGCWSTALFRWQWQHWTNCGTNCALNLAALAALSTLGLTMTMKVFSSWLGWLVDWSSKNQVFLWQRKQLEEFYLSVGSLAGCVGSPMFRNPQKYIVIPHGCVGSTH